jgi:hypothetical protein
VVNDGYLSEDEGLGLPEEEGQEADTGVPPTAHALHGCLDVGWRGMGRHGQRRRHTIVILVALAVAGAVGSGGRADARALQQEVATARRIMHDQSVVHHWCPQSSMTC